MALALLYTCFFALSGLCVSSLLFRTERFVLRIYYGLVLGLLLLTWLPSLFAFFIGFTMIAQILAAGVALALALVCLLFAVRHNGRKTFWGGFLKRDLGFLWVVVPLFLLGAFLFSSHILKPTDHGVSVGQVTYGDLAMHLGFISSIAVQGTFPPEYSIFPGHTVNYPFLCETSASSLVVLGANLRQAYLITALYAYFLVLIGVWFFFRDWLKTNSRASVATILFFLGGGFGFAYFFDLAKRGASLNTLLGGNYFSNFAWLLDGFYDTPTNLPTLGLRWVNPIVDMLIPQRATLFGWAFLFPCLRLLHRYAFGKRKESLLPLGLVAGALPLIHTHSFLALGVVSAVFFIWELIARFDKNRLIGWLLYAAIAVGLAAPQLFGFAFRQASESSMVNLHWNWANEADSYLWFYLKNWGWLFILLPVAFLTLSKRDRHVYCAALVLWLLAETMVFQPNNYDNNKLLFIVFAYTCGLVAKLICSAFHRFEHNLRTHTVPIERSRALIACSAVLQVVLLVSFALKIRNNGEIAWYTICTMLFILGLCLWMILAAIRENDRSSSRLLLLIAACCTVYPMVELLFGLWRGYAQTTLYLDRIFLWIMLPLMVLAVLCEAYLLLQLPKSKPFSSAFGHAALHLCAYAMTLTLTLSSTMTILRETKSEYQVYSNSDMEAVSFISKHTEPDGLFLANSYHWNLVTPLTGRSIVTGTSTFLYFHGINNTERERDVRDMFETPAACAELFTEYGVDYILISNAERMRYEIDYNWIDENTEKVFENGSASIYQIK